MARERIKDEDSFFDRVNFTVKCITELHKNKVGEKLIDERSLSELTGFSRATLREAIVILQYEGFISCEWGVGRFIVKPIDSGKLRKSVDD